MQKETVLTPKSKKLNRPGASTPDRLQGAGTAAMARAKLQDRRTTMAIGDYAAPGPGPLQKKRLYGSRISLADTARKPEPENKDLEMGLLYSKYLQTTMIELIMQKKAEESEKLIDGQIGILVNGEDAVNKKLLAMKKKEKDLKTLMKLQEILDKELAEVTALLEKYEKKPVKILLDLQTMLASHNALICKNIIVPDTLEGMQRLHDRMAQCGNTLRSIVHHTIGSKRHTIESINTALQEFTKAHAEIQDLSKKTEAALGSLQILELKEGARSLSFQPTGTFQPISEIE